MSKQKTFYFTYPFNSINVDKITDKELRTLRTMVKDGEIIETLDAYGGMNCAVNVPNNDRKTAKKLLSMYYPEYLI